MTPWSKDAVPRQNQDVVVREEDDEIYVCAADGDTMYTITAVGADIWRAIDGTNTVEDIAELLLAAYDIDRETVEKDLRDYLGELVAKNLIHFV
jgi:hypothetical protein